MNADWIVAFIGAPGLAFAAACALVYFTGRSDRRRVRP